MLPVRAVHMRMSKTQLLSVAMPTSIGLPITDTIKRCLIRVKYLLATSALILFGNVSKRCDRHPMHNVAQPLQVPSFRQIIDILLPAGLMGEQYIREHFD